MRIFQGRIIDVIEQCGLNLNKISKASGISNAYLAKLVQGKINRPGKDKVASIMLALNHTISNINHVLAQYDYRPLHEDDIPDILKNNRQRTFEGGNLTQYDHIYFDLLLVALERIGGTKIQVKNRPSGIFLPHKLYLMKEYPYEKDTDAAQFRYRLTESLLKERMQNFLEGLRSGNRLETYICKACFTDYLERHISQKAVNEDPDRAEQVVRYIANALSLALKRPDLHRMLIMERCPYFHFMMQDADSDAPKVSYPGRKMHTYNNQYDKRMLEGFTTDLPPVVQHFRQEIDMCRGAVDQKLAADYPNRLVEYVCAQFDEYQMGERLQRTLDYLMQTDEISFY